MIIRTIVTVHSTEADPVEKDAKKNEIVNALSGITGIRVDVRVVEQEVTEQ